MSQDSQMPDQEDDSERREFLKKCGGFAAITPPAITLLLSTSLTSPALAYSAGAGPGKSPHKVPTKTHPVHPSHPAHPVSPKPDKH